MGPIGQSATVHFEALQGKPFDADLVVRFASGASAVGKTVTFLPGVQINATNTAGVDRFGAWPLQQKLTPPGGTTGDGFGSSVAASGDHII